MGKNAEKQRWENAKTGEERQKWENARLDEEKQTWENAWFAQERQRWDYGERDFEFRKRFGRGGETDIKKGWKEGET
jgi:hypothetical protein